MAGPWQSALDQRRFNQPGNSPSAPQVGMGAGGQPFAPGLMAKPKFQPMNPGTSGNPAPAPPGGPGMPGVMPGPGGPTAQPPAAPASPGGAGSQTPMETQQAMLTVQSLVQTFKNLAERNRLRNGNPVQPQ